MVAGRKIARGTGTAAIPAQITRGRVESSDFCKTRVTGGPNVAGMQQRLNVLTLGVDDVGRARSCYEALGWKIGFTDDDIVMFQAGPMIISWWDRAWIEALRRNPDGTVELPS